MTTVRIKSSHPPSQGPFVLIDAHTFDPAKHVLWGDEPQSVPVTAETIVPAAVEPVEASAAPEPSLRDETANAIPDDWETLPWFSLRQRVERETGIRPRTKAEAVKIMKARG